MQDLLTDLEPVQLARVRIRYVACCIDYIILTIIILILVFAFGEPVMLEDGSVIHSATGFQGFVLSFIPWFVIFPLIESINDGQTIGKAIFGLKVVDLYSESKPGFGKLVVRRLFDIIDYLPFFGIIGLLVAGNSAGKQRVADLVTNTHVVKVRGSMPAN